jgi:AcrR family transcriptional regulator
LLLDAAEGLLASAGPEGVTVRNVARAAGTTTRGVYSVFGSKAGLIEALAARGYGLLATAVNDVPVTDDPRADLVTVGLEGFRRFALERPHLFRLTFERAPAEISEVPSVVEAAMSAYGALASHIDRIRAIGQVAQSTAEIAFMFHALCVGLASNELAREPPPLGVAHWRHVPELDLDRVWRAALEALVSGLSGPAA